MSHRCESHDDQNGNDCHKNCDHDGKTVDAIGNGLKVHFCSFQELY